MSSRLLSQATPLSPSTGLPCPGPGVGWLLPLLRLLPRLWLLPQPVLLLPQLLLPSELRLLLPCLLLPPEPPLQAAQVPQLPRARQEAPDHRGGGGRRRADHRGGAADGAVCHPGAH